MKASQRIVALVNEALPHNRGNWVEAWAQVESAHPDLHILCLSAGKPGRALRSFALANERQRPADEKRRAQVAEQMNEAARGHQQKYGGNYAAAWGAAERNNPELASELQSFSGSNVRSGGCALENSGSGPMACPQFNTLMQLPMDASQAEIDAAWEGNGKTLDPVRPGKIFEALVSYLEGARGLTMEQALEAAKTRYSWLWGMVKATAKN